MTFPLIHEERRKKQHRPTLTIRSKFLPYDQVRKMFWFHLARVYDAEDTNALSKLELQSMLETIGSTITEATMDSFWERHHKDPLEEELPIDELIESLENCMKEEAYWYPVEENDDEEEEEEDLLNNHEDIDLAEELIKEEDSRRLSQIVPLLDYTTTHRHTVEKVIRLKECPICHRPNLGRKSQIDIITHVATCAANDWTKVDRFLMGDFLTEAYAQRRYTIHRNLYLLY